MSDAPETPSRSQQRRDALAVLELAERLVELPPGVRARLELPAPIEDAIGDTRRITQQIAHKRQLQYLAKLMRREEPEVLDAWRAALEHDRDAMRRETAELHRLEQWRDALVEDPDRAIGELAGDHPRLDRQHLRSLARQARTERLENRPSHAYRELFRALRELFAGEE